MPQTAKKVQKTILSIKITLKVTRSLTLVSFERASLVEYGICLPNMKSLSLMASKVKVSMC